MPNVVPHKSAPKKPGKTETIRVLSNKSNFAGRSTNINECYMGSGSLRYRDPNGNFFFFSRGVGGCAYLPTERNVINMQSGVSSPLPYSDFIIFYFLLLPLLIKLGPWGTHQYLSKIRFY
jgi:hypothetical protein